MTDRNAAFTVLLEWPDFGEMEHTRAGVIITDFIAMAESERWTDLYAAMVEYRRRITANDTTAADALNRYCDTLLNQAQGVFGLPPGMTVKPATGSSRQ